MTWHTIGTLDEFDDGTAWRVTLDGLDIALFKLDGEFYAVSDRCPHKGAPLSRAGVEAHGLGGSSEKQTKTRGGIDETTREIYCPWHGMKFDLDTGECHATDYRIRSYDVEIEDDTVKIRL